jgi:hypothetical protein
MRRGQVANIEELVQGMAETLGWQGEVVYEAVRDISRRGTLVQAEVRIDLGEVFESDLPALVEEVNAQA